MSPKDPIPGLSPTGIFEQLVAIAKNPPKRAGGGTKKGDRRAHWEIAKLVASRRKNARKRTVREFWKREAERKRTADKRNRRREPYRNRDTLCRVMVPGEWHGFSDLARAGGMTLGSATSILSRMRHAGLVTNQDGAWTLTEAGIVEKARIEALWLQMQNAAACDGRGAAGGGGKG